VRLCRSVRSAERFFMRIQVKTVGTLKALEEGPRIESLEVELGISVAEVMERLNFQDWEIGFIQINGQRADKESVLKENDELTLIAPLVGG
jgi:hypothetical protein